jgi:hypothetical protein
MEFLGRILLVVAETWEGKEMRDWTLKSMLIASGAKFGLRTANRITGSVMSAGQKNQPIRMG